ncbi:MAG: heavy-metal-associated domain-containing protein [Anaerolineaceae bacterium]|jgi:copper ion binding protein|nr:heavy-metal-associated domain-containing protein [Anaerolineaceae bacterium]
MQTVTYEVPGIHCNHCVHTIKMELSEMDGVQAVDANAESKKVTVEFDAPASPEKIESLLAEINYPVQK